MKIIYNLSIITLFLTICNAVFGQDNDDSKWKIGVVYSPDLCYRWQPDVQTSIVEFVLQNKLTSKFGYHTGIGVIYELKTKLHIQVDLRYSFMGVRTKNEFCITPNDTTSTCSMYYNYHFFEFPIGANYVLGSGKLQFVISAYFSPAFHLRNSTFNKITSSSGSSTKEMEETESTNFKVSLYSGVRTGAQYQLNQRLLFSLQPEFKIGLTNDFYHSHLWSLGLNIGCYYNL